MQYLTEMSFVKIEFFNFHAGHNYVHVLMFCHPISSHLTRPLPITMATDTPSQDESAGSLSTGSGLDLDDGEEGLGAELQDDDDDDNAQLGSDEDF